MRGLPIGELTRSVWRNLVLHDCFARAAQVAFFFQLALFPMLIFLLTLMTFLLDAHEIIMFWLAKLMPPDAMTLVEKWAQEMLRQRSPGLLSFSLVFALWSASYGVGALITSLNEAYQVAEGRPFWKSQLLALGLTVALAFLIVGGVLLITFGGQLTEWARGFGRFERGIGAAWNAFRYVTGLAMLVIGMAVVYYFGPNVKQQWRWIVPGTLFAVAAFVIVSYVFSIYMRYAPTYYVIYGSLGAVVILMLWLYLMALIMYVGGEINSAIQKARGTSLVPKEGARSQVDR